MIIQRCKAPAAVLLILACLWIAAPAEATAASDVSVKLPSFPVSLNGRVIDNAYRQYPLLVYNNITYFPMTYGDCRFLGVETEWNGSELRVEAVGKVGEFHEDKAGAKNRSSYRATVADFPIYVNGRRVYNNEQQWPFLLFRDVTYFPLTWEFTFTDFHWSNQFSAAQGLRIDCTGKWTGAMMSATLPLALRTDAAPTTDGKAPGAAALAGETLYYESDDGKIYSAPVGAPRQGKAIYELPVWTYSFDGGFVYPTLRSDNGRVFLYYWQGGASMGHAVNLILDPNGVVMELPGKTRSIGDKLIAIKAATMPMPGNLLLRGPGDADFKAVGDPDLVHSFGDSITVEGNFIYTAAYSHSAYYDQVQAGGNAGLHNIYVYRTDMTSGESRRVTEESMPDAADNPFYLDGKGSVYYLNREGLIRKRALAGGKAENALSFPVSDFALTPDELYYVPITDNLAHKAKGGAVLEELPGDTSIGTELEVWNGVLHITTYYKDTVTRSLLSDSLDNPFSAYSSVAEHVDCTDGRRLFSIDRGTQ